MDDQLFSSITKLRKKKPWVRQPVKKKTQGQSWQTGKNISGIGQP
jgi:hypothetical protein